MVEIRTMSVITQFYDECSPPSFRMRPPNKKYILYVEKDVGVLLTAHRTAPYYLFYFMLLLIDLLSLGWWIFFFTVMCVFTKNKAHLTWGVNADAF